MRPMQRRSARLGVAYTYSAAAWSTSPVPPGGPTGSFTVELPLLATKSGAGPPRLVLAIQDGVRDHPEPPLTAAHDSDGRWERYALALFWIQADALLPRRHGRTWHSRNRTANIWEANGGDTQNRPGPVPWRRADASVRSFLAARTTPGVWRRPSFEVRRSTVEVGLGSGDS